MRAGRGPSSCYSARRFSCSARFIGLLMRNMDINMYAQIGFVMLIGLAAKAHRRVRKDEGRGGRGRNRRLWHDHL
jgi:hypothetical protein